MTERERGWPYRRRPRWWRTWPGRVVRVGGSLLAVSLVGLAAVAAVAWWRR